MHEQLTPGQGRGYNTSYNFDLDLLIHIYT